MPGGMTGRPAGVHGLPFNQASGMRPPLPGVHGMQAGQLGMGSPMANPGGLPMAGQPGLPGQMAAHRGAPSHMQGIPLSFCIDSLCTANAVMVRSCL